MLHFDGHTLSIKKVTFAKKSGEYFEKDNIYVVNFDPGICISVEYMHVKEYMTPTKFYTLYSKSKFLCRNGNEWPLYHEICQHSNFSRPSDSWVIHQNVQNTVWSIPKRVAWQVGLFKDSKQNMLNFGLRFSSSLKKDDPILSYTFHFKLQGCETPSMKRAEKNSLAPSWIWKRSYTFVHSQWSNKAENKF